MVAPGEGGGQDATPVLSPGDLVLDERFRLIRPLARGGMGEVFLAEQVSLGRQVALKVLRRDLREQPGMNERFRREAMLLAQIDHPNVVGIVEYGLHDGASILVMDYVEGRTLESALDAGAIAPEVALPLLLQVADGLAAIHDAGIVHRDLKPENVLLSPGSAGERARLLDFGIARLADANADSTLSQIGVVLGTPEYLSPEQAAGIRVDARADIYSFGLIAYRCLAGELPFRGESPRSWLSLHLTALPPRLESVRPALAGLPGHCRLIHACLEKEPDQRPADARALAAALRSPALQAELAAATQGARPRTPLAGTRTVSRPQVPAARIPTPLHSPARAPMVADDVYVRTPGRSALSRRGPELLLAIGITAVIAVGAWWLRSRSVAERASALISEGAPDEALALLGAPGENGEPMQHARVRAAALHGLERHEEEHAILRSLGAGGLTGAGESVLTGLAIDFARDESGAALRELLSLWPRSELDSAFSSWGREHPSERTWGLLRFMDRAGRLGSTSLVPAYLRFLDSQTCATRKIAASRLGTLGAGDQPDVTQALEVVAGDQRRGCGREEARASLGQLGAR